MTKSSYKKQDNKSFHDFNEVLSLIFTLQYQKMYAEACNDVIISMFECNW